jgi:ubiquinone/menaquinone biosynthesis C-methylase UbiE
MSNLNDQYQCPTGPQGRLVAARMNRHHVRVTSWGLTKVTISPDFVILDVGCGGGKTVGRLAQLVPTGKVFGLDYSAVMVEYSKKVNKALIARNRVEILEGSVEKMSFADGFFDLVTAFETSYFWSVLPVAFAEIWRVLNPGGRLLLVNEMKFGASPAKIVEETHVKLYPLAEIETVLLQAGFVDVQVFTEAGSDWNAFVAQK